MMDLWMIVIRWLAGHWLRGESAEPLSVLISMRTPSGPVGVGVGRGFFGVDRMTMRLDRLFWDRWRRWSPWFGGVGARCLQLPILKLMVGV
ncbi:MAG: hypothetical protein LLF97_00335 [Planctomycetaceae bacterium]|nr:hypothetical protein [Planctomycetaceae bacterium]